MKLTGGWVEEYLNNHFSKSFQNFETPCAYQRVYTTFNLQSVIAIQVHGVKDQVMRLRRTGRDLSSIKSPWKKNIYWNKQIETFKLVLLDIYALSKT